jgi:nitronate monooxygenase
MQAKASNRSFAELVGIEHPIIQGPFGGGLSTRVLTSMVSNLGGLGSFGAHHLAPNAIGELIHDLRASTDRPFAVNLWISNEDPEVSRFTPADFAAATGHLEPYFRELGLELPSQPEHYAPRFEEQIEALLDAAPPVFSFVFGIPEARILAACRTRGIVTLGAATSVAEALALQAAGVDAIVATGCEAGGHRPSFLAPPEQSLMGTFVLTQLVANAVRVPVVAAGGVATHRAVAAALVLGASAVQVGTAFLACKESGTTDEHRALLLGEGAQATTLTRAFSGRLARGLRNRWTDEIAPTLPAIAPYPIQSWLLGQLRAAAVKQQRTDLVSLWGGQCAPLLEQHDARSVFHSLLGASSLIPR